MLLCYDCTLQWLHRLTLFCIFNDICKGISSSAVFNNPAWEIHQTLTIVRFLDGSNCDLRVIPNRACAERSCESILKSRLWFQTKLNSSQSNYHYHLKYYCEFFFPVYFFSFQIVFTVFLGVRKMGGPWTRSIFWWTRSMDRVHGGGPWTRGPCFVLSHLTTTTWAACSQNPTAFVSNLFSGKSNFQSSC